MAGHFRRLSARFLSLGVIFARFRLPARREPKPHRKSALAPKERPFPETPPPRKSAPLPRKSAPAPKERTLNRGTARLPKDAPAAGIAVKPDRGTPGRRPISGPLLRLRSWYLRWRPNSRTHRPRLRLRTRRQDCALVPTPGRFAKKVRPARRGALRESANDDGVPRDGDRIAEIILVCSVRCGQFRHLVPTRRLLGEEEHPALAEAASPAPTAIIRPPTATASPKASPATVPEPDSSADWRQPTGAFGEHISAAGLRFMAESADHDGGARDGHRVAEIILRDGVGAL